MAALIGVHTSVRRGFLPALRDAVALGCDAFQMFTQSPRGWRTREEAEAEYAAFRAERSASRIRRLALHSPYLPNLCTTRPELHARSLEVLKEDLGRSAKFDADYLVIHPGAYSPGSTYQEGLARLLSALNDALEAVPGRVKILVENVAGGGRRVGSTSKELADILSGAADRRRVGVCFDTCHAFGAGYDLSSAEGAKRALDEWDRAVGLDAIEAFHVNDSAAALGSHLDIHEHLGQGKIGHGGLRVFLGAAAFRERVFILETPKHPIPTSDLINLEHLRGYLSSSDPSLRSG